MSRFLFCGHGYFPFKARRARPGGAADATSLALKPKLSLWKERFSHLGDRSAHFIFGTGLIFGLDISNFRLSINKENRI